MTPFLEHLEPIYDYRAQEKIKEKEELEFKNWLEKDLPSQYLEKTRILNEIGILTLLSIDEIGIVGLNGKEYPLPSFDAIKKIIEANPEAIRLKYEQGFQELEINPIALPLENLIEILKKRILIHHKNQKLFKTKKNFNDTDKKLEPLPIDEEQPIFSETLSLSKIIYYPQDFSPLNHSGFKKNQLLERLDQTAFPGFSPFLWEKNANLPKSKQGKTLGKRKQLETNEMPRSVLRRLQTDPNYKFEQGMTLEDHIISNLLYLERYNQLIDDQSEHGSIAYLLGSYIGQSDSLLAASWNHSENKLLIIPDSYEGHHPLYGSRTVFNLSQF
jgi:hypothetical protein